MARGFKGSSALCDGSLRLMTEDYLFSWCRLYGLEMSRTSEMWQKLESPPPYQGDTLTKTCDFNQDSLGPCVVAYSNNKVYGVPYYTSGLVILDVAADSLILDTVFKDFKVIYHLDTIIDTVHIDTVMEWELSVHVVVDMKILGNYIIIATPYGLSAVELSGQGIPINYENSVTGNFLCRILIDSSGVIPVYNSYPGWIGNSGAAGRHSFVASWHLFDAILLRRQCPNFKSGWTDSPI